jgi:hypothetical protein
MEVDNRCDDPPIFSFAGVDAERVPRELRSLTGKLLQATHSKNVTVFVDTPTCGGDFWQIRVKETDEVPGSLFELGM